jgi:hypothetical protein
MKNCKSAWMFNASSGGTLCDYLKQRPLERAVATERPAAAELWRRQRSVKPECLALVPDLCLVAGCASVCCRLDRVEDRFLFVQVFAVNLILYQHSPARFSLITVDSKEHRDEPQGVPGVLAYLWSVDALAEY